MDDFKRNPIKYSIVIPCWFYDGQDGRYREDETFWFAQECLSKLLLRLNPSSSTSSSSYTPTNQKSKSITTSSSSTRNYEIIIIDNGSTLTHFSEKGCMTLDLFWNSADVLIRNRTNLGFGPACNQGFAVARGKYIICLNNDVIVWPGWIEALTDVLEDKTLTPAPGVVMPALMKQTKDARDALQLKEIDLSSNFNKVGGGAEFGSCWMMKKTLMDEIKQKDGHVFNEEAFKLGFGEDRDLWDRVRRMGYQTYRCHKTRVFHQGNMTIGKVPDRKKYTTVNREKLKQMIDERNKD